MSPTQKPGISLSPSGTAPIGNLPVNADISPGVPALPPTRTGPPADSKVPDLATVEAMRAEILRLNRDNETQRKKIAALTAPSSTAEDFAAAVQSSVDDLQRRLATMTNPVSDFAVREFRLEATVRVDINELGKIHYYFLKPGEDVDPTSLSRVVLNLAPIPKQQTAAVDLRTADSLRLLPNLTKGQKSLLEKRDIHTLGDLISAGTRARSSIELSSLLRVNREQLATTVRQAELLTIPGITAEMLPSLGSVGASDVSALADIAPEALVERLAKLKPPVTLSLEQATKWINAAKQLVARRG